MGFNPYDVVAERGDTRSENTMRIYLYPYENTRDLVESCSSGGIVADTLVNALDQVYSNVPIDGYRIERWRLEENGLGVPFFTNLDYADWSEMIDGFNNFLQDSDEHGWTGNLKSRKGVHRFIHSSDTGCNETVNPTSSRHAPYGAGGEYVDTPGGWDEGRIMWSPYCPEDVGLTKNAAIQEMIHQFALSEFADPWLPDGEDDYHATGKVSLSQDYDYLCSPLITYHWDDDISPGDCHPGDNCYDADGHNQTLTDCTLGCIQRTMEER